MKKTFVKFVLLLGLSIPAFAKDISTLNGHSHLNKGGYDSLDVNGELTFIDLDIKNLLTVNGIIKGKNLKCKTMKSNGSVNIDKLEAQEIESNGSFSGKDIHINGKSKFNGDLVIENGRLNTIQISNIQSTFIKTQVNGNIDIKKNHSGWSFFGFKFNKPSIQILELKDSCSVKGDIIFEDEGEVHIFKGSKVDGRVVNGKLIKK